EAHALFEHLLGQYKLVDVFRPNRRPTGYTSDFALEQACPLRGTGEEVERPGQRHGGCLMARKVERQQVVDELLVAHRRTGLGITSAHEPMHQVVARVAGS